MFVQSRDGEDIACSSMFLAYRAITLKNINFFLENKELFEAPDVKYNVVDDDRRITEYLDQGDIDRLYGISSPIIDYFCAWNPPILMP